MNFNRISRFKAKIYWFRSIWCCNYILYLFHTGVILICACITEKSSLDWFFIFKGLKPLFILTVLISWLLKVLANSKSSEIIFFPSTIVMPQSVKVPLLVRNGLMNLQKDLLVSKPSSVKLFMLPINFWLWICNLHLDH